MIVIMKPGATTLEVDAVIERAERLGCRPQPIRGEDQTIVALVGDLTQITPATFDTLAGVARAVRVQAPHKLSNRLAQPEGTVIEVHGVRMGGPEVVVMAGPCSVEGRDQILETAKAVKAAGAKILRGGAFKPRTSPYEFQGLGEEGLQLLAEAREVTGLPIITEVMTVEAVPLVASYADILQVGARNMQNYGLLQALGKTPLPVMLKRGISGTIKELLLCAEYIMSHGNSRVMLCERGIRTYETATRNTFDLNAVPVLKMQSHLPVVADPSHGTGLWELVSPMARAAVAAGADALMIEVHPEPDKAWSDGRQSLKPKRFASLMSDLRKVAAAVGRNIGGTDANPPVAEA